MLIVNFLITLFFFIGIALVLKRHLFLLVLLWVGHFWMALSSAYIETGVYITEQQRFAFSNGATVILIIVEFFFWFGLWISIKFSHNYLHQRKPVRYDQKITSLLLYVVAFALFLLLVNVLLTGSPLINRDLTRFNFWENSALPFLNTLFGDVGAPLIVVLGAIFAISWRHRDKKNHNLSLSVFLIFHAYYFLIGQKFSMQLMAASLFIAPLLVVKLTNNQSLAIKPRYIITAISLSVLITLFVKTSYVANNAGFVDAQGGGFRALIYRTAALQGHVWWGGVNEYLMQRAQPDESLFQSIFNGMTTMMYAVAPTNLVEYYLSNGIRFTMAYPAIIVYKLGMIGALLFQLIVGMSIGRYIVFCEKQLLENRLLGSICALMILSGLVNALNMGAFSDLLSIKILVPLVALMFLTINRT